ncbi:hypothetical protein, partial [Escherichia coli]|uniref:hypothetical protein n=1 Tax=Escherichia coli TaxID=562 RepID=UPI001BB471D6
HAFSSGAGRTSDGNGSHASTLKSPSYTKSVSWQHYQEMQGVVREFIDSSQPPLSEVNQEKFNNIKKALSEAK